MRRSVIAALSVAVLGVGASAFGQVATWDNTSNDWNTNHWTWDVGSGFPNSPTQSAVINGGAVNLPTATIFQVLNLTLGGGSLGGPGQVTVNGAFTQTNGNLGGNVLLNGTGSWTGGNWNNGGTTTVGSTGSLTMNQGNLDMNSGHALVNNGTVTFSGGTLRGGSGTTITNNALFLNNATGATGMNNVFGGAAFSFVNSAGATYRKTGAGAFFADGGVSWQNYGTVDTQAGSFTLNGGTAFNGSTFNAAANATNALQNYTLTGTVSFTGAGANVHNAGTLAGTHTIVGRFDWTGGDFTSAGTTTIAPTATFYVSAGTNDLNNGRVFQNNGTMVHTLGDVRGGGSGASVINNAGLFLEQAGASTFNSVFGGPGMAFNNTGTFRKTADSATTFSNGAFNNVGLVDTQAGTLTAQSGGATDGATFTAAAGAVNALQNYTLTGSQTFNGAGSNVHNAGNLFGTHSIVGRFDWTGGNWASLGVTTVTAGASLYFSSGSDDFNNGRTFINNGTIVHTQGDVRGGGSDGGSLLTNNGLYLEQAGDSALNSAFGGAEGLVVDNLGTFRKTSVSSTTSSNATFNNRGLVDTQAGVFTVQRGTAFNGSEFHADANATNAVQNYTLSGNVSFTGAGQNVHNAGTISGDHTLLGTLRWTGGDFASAGTTTVGSNATLVLNAGSNDYPNSRTFENNGTMQRLSGDLRGGGSGTGSILNNNALFLDSIVADSAVNSAFGGVGQTINNGATGIWRKTTPSLTTISSAFNNLTGGVVDGQAGTTVFNAGTASTGSTFTAAAGASNAFGGYTFDGTVNLNGAGSNRLSGTLFGTHTINGRLDWSGGDLASAGTTTISPGSSLVITTSDAVYPNGRTIVNNGTINRLAGELRGGGSGTGSILNNNALFLDAVVASNNVNSAYGGVGQTINNNAAGTWRKTGAGTTALNNSAFNNSGLVDTQAGVLRFGGGTGMNASTFNAAVGATNAFDAYTFDGAVMFTGPGTNVLASGVTKGTFSVNGTLSWGDGNLASAGTTTINQGATVVTTGGDITFAAARTIRNNGTFQRNTGELRAGGGAVFNNAGQFNDVVPTGNNVNNAFGGSFAFNNLAGGTYSKAAASTTSFGGVPFTNAGVVDVSAGLLAFNAGYTQTGGRTQLTGGGMGGNSVLNIQGGTLAGSGSITNSVNITGGAAAPSAAATGNGAGLLSIGGDLMIAAGGAYNAEILGFARGTGYDALNAAAAVTLGGALNVSVTSDSSSLANLQVGTVFTILDKTSTGAISGTFSGLPEASTFNSGFNSDIVTFRISYLGGTGNDVTLTVTQVVPEPASAGLALLAAPALLARRRR